MASRCQGHRASRLHNVKHLSASATLFCGWVIEFTLALVPHANLTNQTDIGSNVGFSFDLFHNIPVIDSLVPPVSGTLPLGQINVFKGSFDLALNTQSYDFFA